MILVESFMTWLFVSINPDESNMTPEPEPSPCLNPNISLETVSETIDTTEDRTDSTVSAIFGSPTF